MFCLLFLFFLRSRGAFETGSGGELGRQIREIDFQAGNCQLAFILNIFFVVIGLLLIITVGESRWHDFRLFVGDDWQLVLVIDPIPLKSRPLIHQLILSARL